MRECSSHTMCHVSCVMCHVSQVMCHVSRVTCHLSHVTCHVSPVTCHLSRVTCHMPKKNYIFLSLTRIGQSGGASRWRVCYQQGLPRLVVAIQTLSLTSPKYLVSIHPCEPLGVLTSLLSWPLYCIVLYGIEEVKMFTKYIL